MLITMVAVLKMQLTIIEIIHMVAMWDLLVSTADMIASALDRRAGRRILLAYCDNVIIIMVFMREVQVPLV
jgi:hypothetical protein